MTITNEEEYERAHNRMDEIYNTPFFWVFCPKKLKQELIELAQAAAVYSQTEYNKLGLILGLLKTKRVFSVRVHTTTVDFIEECDDNFFVNLNKSQVLQLAQELTALANRLP